MSEQVKLGKVAMTLGGDYSSSQSYDKLTCVQYDGCSWVSKKRVPEGVAPTSANTAYWQKISDRGLQGATGAPGQSYVDKELVPIVNDLTTGGSANVLSAEQGKVLDGKLAELSAEVGSVERKIAYTDNQDLNRAIKYMYIYKNGARSAVIVYVNRNNGELRLNIDGVIHTVTMRDGNVSEYAYGLFIIANIDYSLIQQDGEVIYDATVSPYVFDGFRFKTYLDAVTIYPQVPYLSNRTVDDSNGNSFNYNGYACSGLIAYRPYYVYNGTPLHQIMCYSEIQYIGYVNDYNSIPTHTKFIKLVWITSDAVSASLMPPSQVNDNSISDAKIISINGNKIEDNTITPAKLSFEIEGTNIKVGEKVVPRYNGVIDFPRASVYQDGYMSKEDKQKLDSLPQASITITGSGVYKNASSFGFLPTASATANKSALEAALIGGGKIVVDIAGTYQINGNILIPSNTELVFATGVVLSRNDNTPLFLNEHFDTYIVDENITIRNLSFLVNSKPATSKLGIRGYVTFAHVKNLLIDGYYVKDLDTSGYGLQVTNFENIEICHVVIEGMKDGIHLGPGTQFHIHHVVTECYDDAVTLNAVDFVASNPDVGWITNGVIEKCIDKKSANHDVAGYFSRLMAGAWVDWYRGMEVINSSICIVTGDDGVKRMYRAMSPDPTAGYRWVSYTQPSNTIVGGYEEIDVQVVQDANGRSINLPIKWYLIKDCDITYDGGVSNVVYRDIDLDKGRSFKLECYQDNMWLNSVVEGCVVKPIHNIVFDNIRLTTTSLAMEWNAPFNNIRFINSTFITPYLLRLNVVPHVRYEKSYILFANNAYYQDGNTLLVALDEPNIREVEVTNVGMLKKADTTSVSVFNGVILVE